MSGAALLMERPATDFWSTTGDDLLSDTPALVLVSNAGSEEPSWGGHSDDALAILKRARFERLADELATASAGVSATRRLTRSPEFVEILLMGDDAIPMLIERVETGETRPTWMKLLGLLTSLPPSLGEETIDASADAWLRRARTKSPHS